MPPILSTPLLRHPPVDPLVDTIPLGRPPLPLDPCSSSGSLAFLAVGVAEAPLGRQLPASAVRVPLAHQSPSSAAEESRSAPLPLISLMMSTRNSSSRLEPASDQLEVVRYLKLTNVPASLLLVEAFSLTKTKPVKKHCSDVLVVGMETIDQLRHPWLYW